MTDRQTVADTIRAAFARRDQLREELRAIEQEIAEARTLLTTVTIVQSKVERDSRQPSPDLAAIAAEKPPTIARARSVTEADETRELDRRIAEEREKAQELEPSRFIQRWDDVAGRRDAILAAVIAKGPITASKLVDLFAIPVRLTHTVENDLQALKRQGLIETRTGLVGFVAVGAVIPPAPAPEPAMRAKDSAPLAERRCGRCLYKFKPTSATQYVCTRPECAKLVRIQPDEKPELEVVRSGKEAVISNYSGGSALNAAGRV